MARLGFRQQFDKRIQQMNKKRLIPVASVHIDGTGRFVARDHFRVAVSGDDVVVQISHIGKGFNQFLIDRIEESVEPCGVRFYDLTNSMSDVDIRQELGHEYAMKLGHVWQLLKNQGHGEAGPLITNTWPNVFHIQTGNGRILPVSAQWWGYGVWTMNGGYPSDTSTYLNVSRVCGLSSKP